MWTESNKMVFIFAMSRFMGLCVILLALISMKKDASLTEAFPLQGCQTEDVDVLLVADSAVLNDPVARQTFFPELLDYFLSPDEILRTRLRAAVATAELSEGPSLFFSFPSDNTTDDEVSNPSAYPSFLLSFQTYETAVDVEEQLNLAPAVNSFGLYVNGTLEGLNCNSQDLLEGLRQTSTHVAVIIVGYLWSHGIDKRYDDFSQYARSCRFQFFLILVGHNMKNYVLHRTTQVKTHFDLPSIWAATYLQRGLCYDCQSRSPSPPDASLMLERSCYFLQVHDSPVSWFEASYHCELPGTQYLVSVEGQTELEFLMFMFNNYFEEKYKEKITVISPTDDLEYFESMYIGLARDTSKIGYPFQWMNGNPLVYTHWMNVLLDGGPDQRCGLWSFSKNVEWSESLGKPVYNSSNLEINYSGWEGVGCGSRVTNIAFCEVVARHYEHEYFIESLKIPPANTNSFARAVSRGDFTVFKDKIISIPAHVGDPEYSSFFEETGMSFEVFSCEGENDEIITIPYLYVCDYVEHCKFGEDEDNCWYRTCRPGEMCWKLVCNPDTKFTCSSGQCVPIESRCDAYRDCYDGSDEEDCQSCHSAMCCDGSCLPKHFVFNGEIDCAGCGTHGNDESFDPQEGLRDFDCPFICNRSECVTPSMLNDGVIECLGPEGPLDETWGKLETVNSCEISFEAFGSSVEFVRWSPRCVYIKDRYGTVLGCKDMSHLHDCQNFTCPEGYVKCPYSYCIPLHLVGDDHNDCLKGEEEWWAVKVDCSGNFECLSNVWGKTVCLHPDLVCDGHPHCPLGDDELNCHVSCAEGFRCIGGTVTVGDFDKSKPLHDLSFIDKRTRYLDLSGVNLSAVVSIGKEEQLQHVVKLYLSNCQITHLDENMISKLSLTGVNVLDLSYNLITSLSDYSMLSFMYTLRVLNLSHNKRLTSIADNALRLVIELSVYVLNPNSNIEDLNFAFTSISVLDKAVFDNLPKLKYLNLSHTHLIIINQQTFPDEYHLDTLDLRHTPLSNIEPNALTGLSVSKDLHSAIFKLCCPQVRGQGIPDHVCHAPASAISSCLDLVQEPAQRVLLWTVGVLAVTGNFLVIIYRLLWDRAVLKKSYGLFVTNLSVSDMFMGVYLLIIAGTDVVYRSSYVWYESAWRYSTLCQTAGLLSTLSSETSAFFILLVTIDRFLVIRFPFGHFRFTRKTTILSCVIAWSVGFVLALLPSLPRFQHWQMYSSNGMCLGLPLTPDKRPGWEYSAALFIGLNFILFLFIACGQYLIYRAMSENSLTTSSSVQNNTRRIKEIMVAKQLSLVVLSDFMCWFPIGLMGLLAMSGRDIGREVYSWSAVLVLPINSALNPVLYTVPLIMKKWDDFKSGNSKTETSFTK